MTTNQWQEKIHIKLLKCYRNFRLVTFNSNKINRKKIYSFLKKKGAEGIVNLNLIKILVDKLKTELDEIKDLILDTLHFCLQADTQQALDAKAMEVFTDLLKHVNESIRTKAARDIFDLR